MNLANLKKTIYYLRRNGLKQTYYAVCERLEEAKKEPYQYKEIDGQTIADQRTHVFRVNPLFSIIVPLYRTPEKYLVEMIDSVLGQTYGRLELILADATEDDSVERIVREHYEGELIAHGQEQCALGRIRYCRLEKNGGISENSNRALEYATGDYVGLLDHDDVLTPDALYEMAMEIEERTLRGTVPELLYSDEDKCDQDRTTYYEPHFKADFNLDLLLSNNYICHFTVLKRELIQRLGFRKEYDGAQDYDLVLRAVSRIMEENKERMVEEFIAHIPKILYHWRCHTGSTAQNPQSKQYAYEAGRRALQDMAGRMGWSAEALHLKHLGFYELRYEPDLLTVRSDVGAVGGRLLRDGEICAGAYDREGRALYQGLKNGYSGYMHRGVLLQNVDAVDIRLIRVSSACSEVFRQAVGVPYVTGADGFFDRTTLSENADYQALSLRLGEALRSAGYRICWDPGLCRKL